jgi:hypothetical protein
VKLKKVVCIISLLIFISSFSYANLAQFPSNFLDGDDFDGFLVVGKDGTASDIIGQSLIATKVALFAGKPQMGISVLDSDVTIDNNLILIGSPCVNKLTAELLDNPTPCDKDYEAGKATIKYMEKNGYKYIVAAGITDKANRAAAEYLSNFDRNPLSGTVVEIDVDDVQEAKQASSGMPPSNIVAPIAQDSGNQEEVEDVAAKEEKIEADTINAEPENAQENKPTEKIIVEDKGFFAGIWDWFMGLFK